jgi:hypothetical protein
MPQHRTAILFAEPRLKSPGPRRCRAPVGRLSPPTLRAWGDRRSRYRCKAHGRSCDERAVPRHPKLEKTLRCWMANSE